ncbi:MAG: TfoX/Sxy family protein [Saprospiraceae bacterium]
MAYSEDLALRMAQAFTERTSFEEKKMFGGICFMVNDKMCAGVVKDELMARIHPDKEDEALNRPGCREMDFTGRKMKGYIMVNSEGIKSKKQLDYFIDLALAFNSEAKASKKKNKSKKE